ncbi:arsenic transporter [Desulfurococcaceae archaeon AG1]|nr:MAG: arsenic transporter [Desulfurococcaceae archaeon]GAY26396.1 arsenic transporter [Desulfurococcaceae archaeon AG1]
MPIVRGEQKFIFVGGKGGVGKTVLASAIGLNLAEQGYKTLIASFNPVHSLSSVFEQNLSGGSIVEVKGVSNLYAVEVEIEDVVARYKERITKLIRDFLKWAEIPIDPKGFIEIATTNPAFQEAASFDKMMDLILNESERFDRIVFDTAAVANAIRLIGLSKIYGLWLQRVIKSRQEALSLRAQLSFRKDKALEEMKSDPVLIELLELYKRYTSVKSVLTDPSKTSFIFVTIPTMLSISVVRRFMDMVKAYEIPSGGVVVNMLIPKEEADRDATGFLKSKFEEQERNMEYIRKLFGNQLLGYIPLYPEDIVGIDRLKRLIRDLEAR